MSDAEGPDNQLNDDSLAFEYVSGTLRGLERSEFEARLSLEPALQSLVHTWEEQLMQLRPDIEPMPPRPATWDSIASRISPSDQASPAIETNAEPIWKRYLSRLLWSLSGAMASILVIFLVQSPSENIDQPVALQANATAVDYIAVLATSGGEPALTTLGYANSQSVTLQWSPQSDSIDQDYQLWAISKRDGQTRSIAIMDDSGETELNLSHANWRLLTDADQLILTIEEAGGSPIDEPSDMIVAQGLCVRINHQQAKG